MIEVAGLVLACLLIIKTTLIVFYMFFFRNREQTYLRGEFAFFLSNYLFHYKMGGHVYVSRYHQEKVQYITSNEVIGRTWRME